MRDQFSAKVLFDELDVGTCDYTGVDTLCCPVIIHYSILWDGVRSNYAEEYFINSALANSLESGYMAADEFYDSINEEV